MSERDTGITDSILALVNALADKVIYYSKRQVVSYRGVTLHPGEAHMLLAAVHGLNFSAIARHFGITKGAVSQTMSRLERKGVIRVSKDRRARNAAAVELTDLGGDLIRRVLAIRDRLSPAVSRTLEGFDQPTLEAIELFLVRLENVFSRELVVQRSTQ
jgi:DNA-binding MarR family transcriptional regulator